MLTKMIFITTLDLVKEKWRLTIGKPKFNNPKREA